MQQMQLGTMQPQQGVYGVPVEQQMMQPQQGRGGMQQQTHQVWIKWKKVGSQKPSGQEITNEALAMKLQEKLEFTKEEWDAFGIDLRKDYTHVPIIIKSGEQYFESAGLAPSHTVARKLLCVLICVMVVGVLLLLCGLTDALGKHPRFNG